MQPLLTVAYFSFDMVTDEARTRKGAAARKSPLKSGAFTLEETWEI
jgi:hypothetical protein